VYALPVSMIFLIAYPLQTIAFLAPFFGYVRYRNSLLIDDDQVLTRAHIRFWASHKLRPLGIHIRPVVPKDEGPPVELKAAGAATERENNVNLLRAKQSPGYLVAREVLFDALDQRASSLLLDYTQQQVAVRYEVDGVWHQGEPRDREGGDLALAVMKTVANLNAAERRQRQQGAFGVIRKRKDKKQEEITCRITSQGTKTGERVLIQLDDGKSKQGMRLPEMGMRDKLIEALKQVLEQKNGLVLVSAPPGGGMSTLFYGVGMAMDRYIRSFAGIEDEHHREIPIENVLVTTFNSAAGETPASVLPKLLLEYPDGFVVPDLVDGRTVDIFVDQAVDDRLVLTSIRAKSAPEAILNMLALGVETEPFARALTAVVNQRLIRKLCEKCKEAYTPPPKLLEQLRLPPDKVQAFFRPPQPVEGQPPPEPCKFCRGIGYRGRTGLFELLVVDDHLRQVIVSHPRLDVLQNACRQAGMRTLQDEGLLLVARGVTSLPELVRVLKE
jgi:type II secretory ATPase GspE/PulE/Tfp pilus assembly ATPase PilB-like protein